MNHTRFPKEKHLPCWARQGNKDKKGDRVEMSLTIITHNSITSLVLVTQIDCDLSEIKIELRLQMPRQSHMFDHRSVHVRRVVDKAKTGQVFRHIHINHKKRLLISSYVLPSKSPWLLLDRFLWNLILGTFTKICQSNPNLVKTGQKYWVLYVKTEVCWRWCV